MGVCFIKKNGKFLEIATGELKDHLSTSEMIMDIMATSSRINFALLNVLLERAKRGDGYILTNKFKNKILYLQSIMSKTNEFSERFTDMNLEDFIAELQKIYTLDYTGTIRSLISGNIHLSFSEMLKLFRNAPTNNIIKNNDELYFNLKELARIRNTVAHSDIAIGMMLTEARKKVIEEYGIEYTEKYLSIEDLYDNYYFLSEKWGTLFSADPDYFWE